MTGKTHQMIGLTGGLLYFLASVPPVYQPATMAAVIVVSSVGALLPDIDSPTARIWGFMPFGRVVGEGFDSFLAHRNITHSILGFTLISLGFHWLLGQAPAYWGLNAHVILVAFMVAYASHILADMVTVEGVPLLYPWQRAFGIPPRPFQGARIVTGQWFENLIVFPGVNLLFLLLLYSRWGEIQRVLFK